MAIHRMIQLLETLVDVHKCLLELSVEKTDVIKRGVADELQPLLAKERKYIQLLEQTEAERMEKVNAWSTNLDFPVGQPLTVTAMLELIDNEREKTEFAHLTTELTNTITMLKQQEQLNRDLIKQSMQFIHLSLDMLQPSIQNMNYNKEHTTTRSTNRSVFDSKA